MDFLFHILILPFQAVGFVFQFLLSCFFFIVGMPIGLAVGILKGVLSILLSAVLLIGSPFGIGIYSEPLSSPQIAYQSTQTEASLYSKSANLQSVTNYTPVSFTPAPTPSHDLIRNPRLGEGCECPYDVNKAGKQCGLTSSYSRPGGSEPRCYQDD
jgi:hypothetical protein